MVPTCSALASLCSARPALAIFLVDLLLLALTSLSLALYVHSRQDLPNPDILDWNRLLTEMGELHYCLPSTPPPADPPAPGLAVVSRAAVPLAANLRAFLPAGSASFLAAGWVPLDHMGLGHSGQRVEVTLQQGPGPAVEVCLEGTVFDFTAAPNASQATLLTKEERAVSAGHLLAGAALLLALALGLVCCAPRAGARARGDGRGDMQLLPTGATGEGS